MAITFHSRVLLPPGALSGKQLPGGQPVSGLYNRSVIFYNQNVLPRVKEPAGPKPANIIRWGTKSALPFRRKILYYGLMLLLTVLALEGMGRLSYYVAYGQWYGGGGLAAAVATIPPDSPEYFEARRIAHPFYGITAGSPRNDQNAMPPRQRREDMVIIGLLGGSVANQVEPFLQVALDRWFAANELPRRPVVIGLALGGSKQPRQTMLVANTLLLGGEFDLIVNLDGVNELGGGRWKVQTGLFPFFPQHFGNRGNMTGAEFLLAGRLRALRGAQGRRAAAGATSPLRWSALFGLANRYRQESNAAEIIRLNQQLATTAADYGRQQPESRRNRAPQLRRERIRERLSKELPENARLWYRSSVTLSRLAAMAGADYYHFLQPNQYVPGSKPLSPEEREFAWSVEAPAKTEVELGYPLLRGFNRDLQRQGINYFDLTGIFLDRPETLYVDDCCHLNERGNELMAAEMVRLMGPALRRRGGPRPAAPVSALAAARRPAGPAAPPPSLDGPPPRPDFQVFRLEEGKYLRYVREDCDPADTDPWFFLHLLPGDLTDLPPRSRKPGFANRVFSFWEVGGRIAGGQCAMQIALPDYPLSALRTGQYVPGQGNLWSVELIIPADPVQLRADYAALAAANPVVRDYFDLYELDNRLVYVRETCAAADTAAPFFLHIIPEEVADLPEAMRAAGFDHGGFDFARRGGHFAGKCLAAVSLPDYPIKEMRTGQHIPGHDAPLWSVQLIAAPDLDNLRADYAALSAANPVIRDYFDLYWQDNRLVYVRETCAADDTAANFFLHIVPADAADLPAERRAAGFAHGGFAFVRQGGHFDGKCLAAVALPEYPIREMRTGQHIPGQGDLWSVELRAAP